MDFFRCVAAFAVNCFAGVLFALLGIVDLYRSLLSNPSMANFYVYIFQSKLMLSGYAVHMVILVGLANLILTNFLKKSQSLTFVGTSRVMGTLALLFMAATGLGQGEAERIWIDLRGTTDGLGIDESDILNLGSVRIHLTMIWTTLYLVLPTISPKEGTQSLQLLRPNHNGDLEPVVLKCVTAVRTGDVFVSPGGYITRFDGITIDIRARCDKLGLAIEWIEMLGRRCGLVVIILFSSVFWLFLNEAKDAEGRLGWSSWRSALGRTFWPQT